MTWSGLQGRFPQCLEPRAKSSHEREAVLLARGDTTTLLPQMMPSQAVPQVGQPCLGNCCLQGSNLEAQQTDSFRAGTLPANVALETSIRLHRPQCNDDRLEALWIVTA